MTICRNIIDCEGNNKLLTSDLSAMKPLSSSSLRTLGCKFISTHIKNFPLKKELKDKQHMLMPVELMLEEIMKQWNFHDKNHKGKVIICISKGTCSLREARALANQQLQYYLKPYGYSPSKFTFGPWKNDATKTMFSLAPEKTTLSVLWKR